MKLKLSLLAVLAVMPQLAAAKPPALAARLLLDRDGIAPGTSATLAVQIDIPERWHIYHPLLLDTGLPTKVEFELPAGVSVGPIQYPRPEYGQAEDIAYLAYGGRAVLLTEIAVDASVRAGQRLPVKAEINALLCEDNGLCMPVTALATTLLPVSAADGARANEELFEEARANIPHPLAKAPYLKGSRALVSHSRLPIGAAGEVIVALNIEPGHHINDRDPGGESLIPTRVLIESVDGLELDLENQRWPKPTVTEQRFVGTVRHQHGLAVIRTPLVVSDQEFTPRPVELRVLVEYQACKDGGQCFLPEWAETTVSFTVVPADAPAVLVDDDLVGADETEDDPDGAAAPEQRSAAGMLVVFLFAFLGGIVLNVMPCVLPVISLKIFGFMQQAGESRARILNMGLAYAAGIMTSFLVVALVMVIVIPGATWGAVIMQSPTALIIMCAVVVAFGLSMLGVFEFLLPGAAMNAASQASEKEGYGGAFFHGVLATVLATPCTGPFLGFALGALATLSKPLMFLGIMTVGLGLAFPYVLLTAFPNWLRYMPKPGNWMVTLKQLMGFIMLAVPLWLLWILQFHGGAAQVLWTLTFLFAVAIACWMLGKIDLNASTGKTLGIWVLALAVLAAGWFTGKYFFKPGVDRFVHTLTAAQSGSEGAIAGEGIEWRAWEPGIGPRLAREGHTVFMDYTAAWCLTCQTNKLAVIETAAVRAKFRELGVIAVKADLTRDNPEIAREIRTHGRNGVPVNIVIPANKPEAPILLPELLTRSMVFDALESAGPSKTADPAAVPDDD